MIPSPIALHSPPTFSALVVEPNELDMISIVTALARAGFTVSATDNYPDAKALLATHPPLVLVTEIRLGAYNGLQLALRAQSAGSRVPVVVVSGFADPVLQRDAERAGATFALKPLTDVELLAAVYRTAIRRPNADGAFDPIQAPFERRLTERRQALAEVDVDRRLVHRRRDIASLLLRAASLS
jgi:FixJ family two-component response regulator